MLVLAIGGCVVRGHVGEANRDDDGSSSDSTHANSTLDTFASSESSGDSTSESSGSVAREPGSGSESGDGTTIYDETDVAMFDVGVRPDTTNETTGDPTIDVVDCCAPSAMPGCPDPATQQCVCAMDPYCCDVVWDDACVEIATWSECEACIAPEPPPPDDCCRGLGGRGCADLDVQSCVCEIDPYCCDVAWDEYCAEQVDAHGCGACA